MPASNSKANKSATGDTQMTDRKQSIRQRQPNPRFNVDEAMKIEKKTIEKATPKVKKPKAKVVKIENKLNNTNNVIFAGDHQGGSMSLIVRSSTQENVFYKVEVTNNGGITLKCNCGETWGLSRNSCKHIGCVISNMLKVFVMNHQKIGHQSESSEAGVLSDVDLEDVIGKFQSMLNGFA